MAALSDVGGRAEHFGPIVHDPDAPYFHEDWERRVFGNTVFVQTNFHPTGPNLDAARWAMEQLPSEIHLGPYYARWLAGLERQLEDKGWFRPGEVDARVIEPPAQSDARRARPRTALTARTLRTMIRPTLPRWLCAHVLPRVIGGGRHTLRRPRFHLGEQVRVRAANVQTHTRQPGYTTGKRGEIVAHRGAARFADAHALGRRSHPQHTYTVAFDGTELWGETSEPGTTILVELFEPYLDRA